jgi:hypothetical protein
MSLWYSFVQKNYIWNCVTFVGTRRALQFIDGSKRCTNMRYNNGRITAEHRLLGNEYWELDENAVTWDETYGLRNTVMK